MTKYRTLYARFADGSSYAASTLRDTPRNRAELEKCAFRLLDHADVVSTWVTEPVQRTGS